ncbi:MAG: AraC family transcriptional regulator, partial [Actinomycetes bacterium]
MAVYAYDGMAPFELGVATEVFALPRPELGVPRWYDFALCADRAGPLRVVGGFELVAPHGL